MALGRGASVLGGQFLDLARELPRGQIGDRDGLENAPQARPDGHPHLRKLLDGFGVVEGSQALVVDVGERPVDRTEDVGECDLVGGSGQ